MRVRNATKEDVKAILEIIAQNMIKKGLNELNGLLEYPSLNESELIKIIEKNPFFYVGEEEGEIVGFFAAYDSIFMNKLDLSKDEIASYVMKKWKENKFIYVETIAIRRDFHRKGLGIAFVEILLDDVKASKYECVVCSIAHSPFKNESAIGLANKIGFSFFEEINVHDGLVFGIYNKRLIRINVS